MDRLANGPSSIGRLGKHLTTNRKFSLGSTHNTTQQHGAAHAHSLAVVVVDAVGVGDEEETVPPFLVLLQVLEQRPREDTPVLQRNLETHTQHTTHLDKIRRSYTLKDFRNF